jgi:hypothetical protein
MTKTNENLSREERVVIAQTVADFAKRQIAANAANFGGKYGFIPTEIFIGGSIAGICQFAYELRGDTTADQLADLICDSVRVAMAAMEAGIEIPPHIGTA